MAGVPRHAANPQTEPLDVPTLRGELIRLRGFRTTDCELILDAGHDPLLPWMSTFGADALSAGRYIERQNDRAREGQGWSFAVALPDTDRAVGEITVLRSIENGRGAVSYWINRNHRRRGYATAALGLLTDWVTTLTSFSRLEIYVEPDNQASLRVAEAVKYQYEGLRRGWDRMVGEPRDVFLYFHLV